MEGLRWYDHIELTGLFAVIIWSIGSFIYIILQRFLGKSCATCQAIRDLGDIKLKQAKHREETHVELATTLATLSNDVKNILKELRDIKEELKDKKDKDE